MQGENTVQEWVRAGQTKMIFHPCSNSNELKGLESEGIGHA